MSWTNVRDIHKAEKQSNESLENNLSPDLDHPDDEMEDKSYQNVEALEHALKLQVEKRMEAEAAVKRLQSQMENFTSKGHHAMGPLLPEPQSKESTPNNQNISFFFAQKIKQLIHQLQNSNSHAVHTNSATVNEDLLDFEELLMSFLLEMGSSDIDDDNGEFMTKKDIEWFLQELKMRFDHLKDRYKQNNETMEIFTQRLALLLEEFAQEDEWKSDKCRTIGVEAKEIEIATLKGQIEYLEEALQRRGDNDCEIQNYQRSYDELTLKHKCLESRHQALMTEMQQSINEKNKELSTLKNAIGILEITGQPSLTSSSSDTPPTEDLLILQNMVAERDSLITEMQDEIQRLIQREVTNESNCVDKIKIRYLESIVYNLEKKLEDKSGSPKGTCKYGSIACFDIEESLSEEIMLDHKSTASSQ